jgi:hypothetical protein
MGRLAHLGAKAFAGREQRQGRDSVGQADAGRWIIAARRRDRQGWEGDEQYEYKG